MKDYIVVKDYKIAQELIKNYTGKSLKGKWIIIAPDGIKFVSKEEIKKLPQVKLIISSILKDLREKVEGMKEDKTVLSQGGLRPTYMAGFENYRKKVLSLIDTMVEEGKV